MSQKNVPPLACYNFDVRESILTFFGRNVTDEACSQKRLYYATSNNLCFCTTTHHNHNCFTALFWDHPGEPVPEENFWTLWCKGRLTEADILTVRLGATPSALTSAHLHHPPIFFTGWMPFLPPNKQCQSTEGNWRIRIREKTLEFSSSVCYLHHLRTLNLHTLCFCTTWQNGKTRKLHFSLKFCSTALPEFNQMLDFFSLFDS